MQTTPVIAAPTNILFSSANVLISGGSSGDYLGTTIQAIGNITGNASSGTEFIVGAPFKDIQGTADSGAAYFFNNLTLTPETLTTANSAISIFGTNHNHLIGKFIATNGDIDGDNKNDFIQTNPESKFTYIYLGKNYHNWGTSADTQFQANEFNRAAGTILPQMLSISGDVNGDNFDDILIGSDFDGNGNKGRAFLMLGRQNIDANEFNNINLDQATNVDYRFIGETNNDHAGFSVDIAPDINGDGYDDILIGTYDKTTNLGKKVYLFYGGKHALNQKVNTSNRQIILSQADAIFHSKNEGKDGFGETVKGLGDINGDGYGDFAIGAPYTDLSPGTELKEGAIYLYFGSATRFSNKEEGINVYTTKITGIAHNSLNLGLHSIVSPGNVNLDLKNDLLVGEFWSSSVTTNGGLVYIIPGNTTENLNGTKVITDIASHVIQGDKVQGGIGFTVSTATDLDNDGLTEFSVGNNGYNGTIGSAGIFKLTNNVPPTITGATIKLYSDATYTSEITQASNRQFIYVETIAQNNEPTTANITPLIASRNINSPKDQIQFYAQDSIGSNAGKYRGKFQIVRSRSSSKIPQLSANLGDTISVIASGNTTTLSIINAKPVISTINVKQVSTGNLTTFQVDYILADYDNDICNLNQNSSQIQYSANNGTTWHNASVAGSLSSLTASENGTLHNASFQALQWEAYKDVAVTDNYFLLRIQAHDGNLLGRYKSSELFHLDTLVPTPPVISQPPAKHSYLITVTGNGEALSTVEIYVNNILNATGNINESGVFSVFPVSVSSTQNTLTAVVVDAVQFRSSTSNAVTVSFANLAQTLSHGGLSANIVIPLGAVTNDATIIFSEIATENLPTQPPTLYTAKTAFSLSVDNNQTHTAFSTPATVTINLSTPLSTTTGIIIRYFDTATSTWSSSGITTQQVTSNNVTFSTTHFTTFIIAQLSDPIAPTIGELNLNGTLFNDNQYIPATFNLTISAQDADSGIASWSITILNANTSSQISQTNAQNLDTKASLTLSHNQLSTLSDGSYQATVQVWDKSENKAQKTYTMKTHTTTLSTEILHGPNPFNPSQEPLKIGYSISDHATQIDIHILDLRGTRIRHLSANPTQKTPGYHIIEWDGQDSNLQIVPNGLYFGYCVIKNDETTIRKKIKIAVIR